MKSANDYVLTNGSIDEISESISNFLKTLHTENKNIQRIRLIAEEILLCRQEHFSEQTPCKVKIGYQFRRPFIQLEVDGESCNPLNYRSDKYGAYRDRLLSSMGLTPMFSYENGRNKIIFKLKRIKTNPLLRLALAVLSGLLVGSTGLLLPDMLRNSAGNRYVSPCHIRIFHHHLSARGRNLSSGMLSALDRAGCFLRHGAGDRLSAHSRRYVDLLYHYVYTAGTSDRSAGGCVGVGYSMRLRCNRYEYVLPAVGFGDPVEENGSLRQKRSAQGDINQIQNDNARIFFCENPGFLRNNRPLSRKGGVIPTLFYW